MFRSNTVLVANARYEGIAIDRIMRALGNGEGHPTCPACGLRVKSRGHFDQRVVGLERTWEQTPDGRYIEKFVEVDKHSAARLIELARATESSLMSLAAKFAK